MRIKPYCIAILLLPVLLAAAPSLETFAGRKVLRIDIEGHRITREHTIRRELHTTTGQAFDPERWRADLQRLDNLDIFSSLNSNVQVTENGIILVLRMREIPPAVPYISYNVTDEDGWSFGPALKAVNLLGRDLFVAGYALFGGKTTFLLDLNYPWIAGNHLSFDLDGTDPSVAPGVGTPVPGGTTWRESHLVMEHAAASGALLGLEMTEINPILDSGNQTAKAAVELVLSALGKSVL